MSNGSKITGENIKLPNFCIIAANSVITKNIPEIENCPAEPLFAGMPAKIVKNNMQPWYLAHGLRNKERYEKVEKLRSKLKIDSQ